MTTSPAADITAVRNRIKDVSATSPYLSDDDIDLAIQSAVGTDYSRHRPRLVTIDITGDGGVFYSLTDESDWEHGFSRIVSVEYPALDVSSDTNRPTYLDSMEDYREYDNGTKVYLHLWNHTPDATETIRLVITKRHELTSGDGAVDTLYEYDREAVLDLAAGIAALTAASRAAQSHDSGLRSTGVKRGDAHARYMAIAKEWRARYLRHMGLSDNESGEVRAAGLTTEWDSIPDFTEPWLTHWRRPRPPGYK